MSGLFSCCCGRGIRSGNGGRAATFDLGPERGVQARSRGDRLVQRGRVGGTLCPQVQKTLVRTLALPVSTGVSVGQGLPLPEPHMEGVAVTCLLGVW